MNVQSILKEIGLTEGETKVYLALLELGSTTTGPIIEKSGVSASKAYNILDRLSKKGLASQIIKAKTRYFQAANPSRILDYLTEREDQILKQKKAIKRILPVLSSKQKEGQVAELFEGRKGIITARERVFDVLTKGDTLYVIGSNRESEAPMNAYWEDFHQRRTRAGINARFLEQDDMKKIIEEGKKGGLIEAKYLPLMGPIHIDLYGDYTVVNIIKDTQLALSIKNKEVTESFKHYFDLMWQQRVQVFHGRQAAEIGDSIVIQEGVDFIGWGMGRKMTLKYYPDIVDRWVKDRTKHNIKARLLFADATEEEKKRCYPPEINELRALPKEFFSPVTTLVYKTKICLWLWADDELTVMVIDDKDLAKSYRNHFELMWKSAEKLPPI